MALLTKQEAGKYVAKTTQTGLKTKYKFIYAHDFVQTASSCYFSLGEWREVHDLRLRVYERRVAKPRTAKKI